MQCLNLPCILLLVYEAIQKTNNFITVITVYSLYYNGLHFFEKCRNWKNETSVNFQVFEALNKVEFKTHGYSLSPDFNLTILNLGQFLHQFLKLDLRQKSGKLRQITDGPSRFEIYTEAGSCTVQAVKSTARPWIKFWMDF